MRVVLDTNVLVSALLTPAGVPAAVLSRVLSGEPVALYDDRILAALRAWGAWLAGALDSCVMCIMLKEDPVSAR